MSKTKTMKPLAAAIGTVVIATLAATQAANASENPFGMTDLSSGYQVAEGGAEAPKKGAEGQCGEGKCGEGMKKDAAKTTEGKCGEGKCGEGMKKDAEAAAEEGKAEESK